MTCKSCSYQMWSTARNYKITLCITINRNPGNSKCLYELWRKLSWPWILNPTHIHVYIYYHFLFIQRTFVPMKIKPSRVFTCICPKYKCLRQIKLKLGLSLPPTPIQISKFFTPITILAYPRFLGSLNVKFCNDRWKGIQQLCIDNKFQCKIQKKNNQIIVTLTFDLLTPKSIGHILDSLGVCVWSFIIIGVRGGGTIMHQKNIFWNLCIMTLTFRP